MAIDYNELKKNGFLRQHQKNNFSMRLRVLGGRIDAKHLLTISAIAEKYGNGYIHLTSRQSVEIPFIKLDDIEAVKEELASAGLETGAGGAKVRTITACQGNEVCRSGLINTASLAEAFDKRYYSKELPHKFKLGITGCQNNCLKAEENDIGVKGAMQPVWVSQKCIFCESCATVCRQSAISVSKSNKTMSYNKEACNQCGRCVKSCPMDAWEGMEGYRVYFGGLFGNIIINGKQLVPILYSIEEVYTVIDTAMEFFLAHGKKGERFGLTLQRVSVNALTTELEKALLPKK